jgi:hypothetical protein
LAEAKGLEDAVRGAQHSGRFDDRYRKDRSAPQGAGQRLRNIQDYLIYRKGENCADANWKEHIEPVAYTVISTCVLIPAVARLRALRSDHGVPEEIILPPAPVLESPAALSDEALFVWAIRDFIGFRTV